MGLWVQVRNEVYAIAEVLPAWRVRFRSHGNWARQPAGFGTHPSAVAGPFDDPFQSKFTGDRIDRLIPGTWQAPSNSVRNPTAIGLDREHRIRQFFQQGLKETSCLAYGIGLIDKQRILNNRLQVINQYEVENGRANRKLHGTITMNDVNGVGLKTPRLVQSFPYSGQRAFEQQSRINGKANRIATARRSTCGEYPMPRNGGYGPSPVPTRDDSHAPHGCG